MDSIYGLKIYCSLTEEQNAIPDFANDGYSIYSLTEAIRVTKNENTLPYNIKLLHILFKPGFRDVSGFGLYNSLFSAFKNIAEKNYELVQHELVSIIKSVHEDQEIYTFCNCSL